MGYKLDYCSVTLVLILGKECYLDSKTVLYLIEKKDGLRRLNSVNTDFIADNSIALIYKIIPNLNYSRLLI